MIFTTVYQVSDTFPYDDKSIYRSDGTISGTEQIYQFSPYSSPYIFSGEVLVKAGNNLFFKNKDFQGGSQNLQYELWKTDGTSNGTVIVKDLLGQEFCSNLCEMNGNIYFLTRYFDPVWGNVTHKLWKSDGTESGTIVIQSWQNSTVLNTNISIGSYNNKIYFSGFESNGTTSGTIESGVNLPIEPEFCLFNGLNYYRGSDGKLWRTDGTVNGNIMAVDFPIYSNNLYTHNGWIYFTGGYTGAGQTGIELYKTDGTLTNTSLVKDIYVGYNSSFPLIRGVENGLLIFTANDGINGEEIWRTDGTSNGTIIVKNFTQGNGFYHFVSHDNYLYFDHINDSYYDLWRTDGTEMNTILVHTFDSIGEMKEINCNLFVSADGNLNWDYVDMELWSDTSFCTMSNVKNLIDDNKIKASPNPTSSSVLIDVPIEYSGKSWSLYDQTGRIKQVGTFTSTEYSINLESYEHGMYFLHSDDMVPIKIIKE